MMNPESLNLLWPFSIFIILLFITGLYCLLVTYNLVRALIGIELLIKAVTLLIVVVGYISGRLALTQALIITLIVVEVVLIAVAVGVILRIHDNNNSLDARNIRNLKE